MKYSRKIMPLSPFITYKPPLIIYIYSNPSYHHTAILLITCQPSKTEKESQTRQHPRPAPRSGREVSLRRESLSLRRESLSLRRDLIA